MEQRYDYDYIVIGSGFGGSVSALRLSEKGYSVGVLEMGKRFESEDFAKSTWDLRRYFWLPKLALHGIMQISWLKDVLIFHGAGVGGGSLVYANTLLVPPDRAFRDSRWPTDEDWRAKLTPHYEMAKFMLGAIEAKNTFPADELLRQVVDEDMGAGCTFHKHTVGVYYGRADVDAPDPFFGGEGPERRGCIECGSCMVGCRFNAKNTLDKNYLYLAERRGCTIVPETKVTDIRPLDEGGFELDTQSSTAFFRKNRKTYRARNVVLSASALGTVELLMRCKERGSLPDLSGRLGDYVRTNSEAILGIRANRPDVDYGKGIAITSGVFPDEHTHMEIVRYGKRADSMTFLTTLMTGGGPPWPRWLRLLGNIVRKPLDFLKTLSPFGYSRRASMLLVMQPLDNHLRLRMRRGLFGRKLDTELAPGQSVPSYMPIANEVAGRLAEKAGGIPQSIMLEVLGNTASTAHILGGATMGPTPEDGVCDPQGRVFGYEGLYVADGSVIPANLGVNPSLTITALSEYIMSCVPENPEGEVKPAPQPASKEQTELAPK